MSRRHLTYAVLVIASAVMSACAQPTAPAGLDSACRGGYQVGAGNKCEAE